ncbi:MBL fold metallo-hydrolase RNA specificity domain-containing protein [Ructibacterium gallinarum]|uniref:MBL fold metallo-hydrolase n=1 Tax=Ructibacterium gallinarum TaxID=2779355 RepID=A0A9D5RAW1_9FIRM|nr:MBL fold metallo-hydrolase [Ructibacterium gallinarum]MBE5039463.1 MBL fold metallo-hydrolase [Ructibacterium gallinarum]
MNLYFVGAAHEVTGSCTFLEACGKRILIDCGMEQGENVYENVEIPVAPGEIDALLLTHAHIDHSGRIPYMTANGFAAPVYTTEATHELCSIMLLDSAHIQESEAQWRNRKNLRSAKEFVEPLYTIEDAQKALELFQPCRYGEVYDIFEGISIRFIDAGHLLGSASIEICITEDGADRTLLFSGDLGNVNRPLIRDPQMPPAVDYVVIESTYGTRIHGPRPDYAAQLTEVIQSTFDRGGNVVIPSFAVGRTQELLYLLRVIKEENRIRGHAHFPVWVDSPLAVEATAIYSNQRLMEYFDDETLELIEKGVDPIRFPDLKLAVTTDESCAINMDKTPKIILSASGMCEAGRIRHHLKHNLWRPECTVLFVGYQAEGTLGRKIVDGAKDIRLFGEEIHISARIETMEGISGHADRDMLLHWLEAMPQKPKCVFVNHGHDAVCDQFAEVIEENLHTPAIAPYSGDGYELGEEVYQNRFGTRRLCDKKKYKTERANTVYERLKTAGRNLQAVIEQNRGGANKDLARFADQINALCEKYKIR